MAHPDYPAAAAPALLEMEERGEGAGCPTVLLPGIFRQMRPFEVWDPRRLEYYQRALVIAPEVRGLWTRYAGTLASLGRLRDADEVLGEGAETLSHPLERLPLLMRRAGMAFLRGDTSAAVALRQAVAAAVDRDGRPGIRLAYLYELDGPLGRWEEPAEDSWARPARRLAEFSQEHWAWNYEWQARYALGMRLSDRGEPLLAVQELTRALAIADSVDVASLQAQSYNKRGRALGKLGRWDEAGEDLVRSIDHAVASESPYRIAEAWHNLYQMHHDAGHLLKALEAGDRFLEAADHLIHSSLRWAAHLAAGEIRWKLGWHAAANEAFARAVSVIDDHRECHNYAGDYFERQGNLAKAKDYYGRGTQAYGGAAESVRHLNWAGMVRVYLELGQVDSARVAAAAHDENLAGERAIPLLPWILSREGRTEEGIRIASAWAQRRMEAGNIAGASMANLQLAELNLEAGHLEAAHAVALLADSFAITVDLVDESIQANRLVGLVLAELGDTAGALRTLEATADQAATLASARTSQPTFLALADFLASVGRTDEALVAYEKAAGQNFETTAGFSLDFDRVRYRDQHQSPYDGAVLALLRSPEREGRIPELAPWSQRRKAGALRLGRSGTTEGDVSDSTLPFMEVQSRLDDDDALVDFQVVGDSVWALVVRKEFSLLRKLPVATDSLATMVQSLIGAFSQAYGGRIDLARASFDEALSNRLYQAIWFPFSDELAGVRRVFLVPDGVLHRLPFAALIRAFERESDERGSPGLQAPKFLIDEHELIYLPSTGLLPTSSRMSSFHPGETRVLAVAGNAPGAEDEIGRIGEEWGEGGVHQLAGEGASESRVISASGQYEILHFATHAVADDRDPLASHLRFSPDSGSDGLLHPVEVSRIPFGRRLVVLSACETQAGRVFGGEGLMGLSRAFLSGGAEAVVASQWLVGGQASYLMGNFYGHLSSGDPLSSALRAAQLATRAQPETSHPFFWAGFVLHMGGR
ncbi:MAG: CHAT domain-containing protein [Gemmatimonadetes bacterium]|nr:CHAT domain-containing protein [Gemmatimonadota bacterium]